MINITSIPDRFKDAVCQAKDQDILYRFFTELVIDTLNLFFFKDSSTLAVELTSRCEIVSKGLFDDDARPTLATSVQTRGTKTLNNLWILARGRRKVEDAIAAFTSLLLASIEPIIQSIITAPTLKILFPLPDSPTKPF